jgi:hypothetical protein
MIEQALQQSSEWDAWLVPRLTSSTAIIRASWRDRPVCHALQGRPVRAMPDIVQSAPGAPLDFRGATDTRNSFVPSPAGLVPRSDLSDRALQGRPVRDVRQLSVQGVAPLSAGAFWAQQMVEFDFHYFITGIFSVRNPFAPKTASARCPTSFSPFAVRNSSVWVHFGNVIMLILFYRNTHVQCTQLCSIVFAKPCLQGRPVRYA